MSSIEALWAVYFDDAQNSFGLIPGMVNAGVAVIESGKVFGGDSQFFYVGTVEIDREDIHAKVKVTHFNGPGTTAFGFNMTEPFDVEIKGRRTGDVIEGEMWPTVHPGMRLKISFDRLADLP